MAKGKKVRKGFRRFAKTIKKHKKTAELGATAVALLAAGVTAPAAAVEAAAALGFSEAEALAALEWLETQIGTVAATAPAAADMEVAVQRGILMAQYAV